MKKILFSLSLLLCLALGAQAQHAGCSKACTDKSKASCEVKVADASAPIPSEYQTAAAKVASMDATIESRTNPVTGEVTYVRRTTTATNNGEASFVALNFDPATSTFVNVSPSQVAAKENTQGCGAHSTSNKMSCCAAGASTKSCCADKAKTTSTTSTTSTTGAPVKATKASGGSKD